jgi:hypothetical protein
MDSMVAIDMVVPSRLDKPLHGAKNATSEPRILVQNRRGSEPSALLCAEVQSPSILSGGPPAGFAPTDESVRVFAASE